MEFSAVQWEETVFVAFACGGVSLYCLAGLHFLDVFGLILLSILLFNAVAPR